MHILPRRWQNVLKPALFPSMFTSWQSSSLLLKAHCISFWHYPLIRPHGPHSSPSSQNLHRVPLVHPREMVLRWNLAMVWHTVHYFIFVLLWYKSRLFKGLNATIKWTTQFAILLCCVSIFKVRSEFCSTYCAKVLCFEPYKAAQ